MEIGPAVYRFASRYWRTEFGMKCKDWLRPVKHFLVGKDSIYRAIEEVQRRARAAGRTVGTIFDVGAAIGETALPLARAFPRATLYCFEPVPSQFATLTRRTKKFSDRIKYFNYALYDKDDTAPINVHPQHPDASTFLEEPHCVPVTIARKKLDTVVQESGVSHIDFMKIDVEGVDTEVLRGGPRALRMTDNIYIEIAPHRKGAHSHDYIESFEMLHAAGFSLIGVYGDFFFSRLCD